MMALGLVQGKEGASCVRAVSISQAGIDPASPERVQTPCVSFGGEI